MYNYMKTILSAVKFYIDKIAAKINESIPTKISQLENDVDYITEDKIQEQVQSDWNQNDVSSVDYIKNKPFGEEGEIVTLIPEKTLTIEDSYVVIDDNFPKLIAGQSYLVTLNGVEYNCIARQCEDCVLIGNGQIYGDGNISNGEPFSCDSYYGGNIFLNASAGEYTFSLAKSDLVIRQLDKKYIPDEVRVESTLYNINKEEQLQARNNIGISEHNFPELFITDKITGYNYIISMINGKIFYESLCSGEIFVEQMPTQAFYGVNDAFNTDGLIIAAYCEDGSTKEIINYKCSNIDENGKVIITYIENGSEYTTTVNVEIIEYLSDFTYTSNEDGTVTITGWKGTLNGVSSTEMVFPNDPRVIL